MQSGGNATKLRYNYTGKWHYKTYSWVFRWLWNFWMAIVNNRMAMYGSHSAWLSYVQYNAKNSGLDYRLVHHAVCSNVAPARGRVIFIGSFEFHLTNQQ